MIAMTPKSLAYQREYSEVAHFYVQSNTVLDILLVRAAKVRFLAEQITLVFDA